MTHTRSSPANVTEQLAEVLWYYAVQQRPLTLEEIHRYAHVALTIQSCRSLLEEMEEKHTIAFDRHTKKYTVVEYRESLTTSEIRQKETQHKLESLGAFIWWVRRVPFLRFIALTGSCGIDNAQKKDDIDVFIVTSPGRLFLTRLITTGIVQICGLRRKRAVQIDPDKVCMNLWFDQSDLRVPEVKRSLFTARELAQMKVIHDRDGIFQEILLANTWVHEFLPNFPLDAEPDHSLMSNRTRASNGLLDHIEKTVRKIQLDHIKKYRTIEYITDTQLWFHPIDRAETIGAAKPIHSSLQ